MTTLRKALPLIILCALFAGLLSAQGQNDCTVFTTIATGNGNGQTVLNLSQNAPCVNWRITFSTTGTLSTSVTFQTSPDNSTWTAVPNTICSSSVQPPCILQGANPTTGTQGTAYISAYGAYVRVITSGSSGTGTGTIRVYGAKGATASASGIGGGGIGTVTNVATTGPITGGPITSTGTIGLDTTKVAQKFFGTAVPGSVATNLPGDLFTDTTAHNEYVCNAPAGTAAPACTSVTAAGWLLVNGGGSGGSLLSGTSDPGVPVITVVQSTKAASSSPLAYISSVTIGNILWLEIAGETATFANSGITDSRGNTWVLSGGTRAASYNTGQSWYTVAISTGADTVTWGAGATGAPKMIIAEFAGASGTVAAQAAGTAPVTFTTTTPYELLVTGAEGAGGASFTTSGSSIIVQQSVANSRESVLAYEIAIIPGTHTSALANADSPNTSYNTTALLPSPSILGNNGDFYVNLTSGVLWGPKIGGVWSQSAFNFLPTTGQSATNCSSVASPAVCGAASAGSVVVAAAATTVAVNTTAVTANSQILVTFDASLGTKLGVTCNGTEPALYGVTARVAATSFTITSTTPITNPACFSYFIVN